MDEYEAILLVKPEVFVYKIPPRTTARGHKASDWKLENPDWTGRMRLVTKGKECFLKLEDKATGELFAKSPIDSYPGIAIESVTDSSRYFVLRIQDDNGRAAFIGIGFADRGDSFDLNVALQDHFKWLQKSEELEKNPDAGDNKPALDLGFKDGQTITINMNIGKKSGSSKPRPKPSSSGGLPGLLPPPPGSAKIPGPKVNKVQPQSQPLAAPVSAAPEKSTSSNDLLLDLGSLSLDTSQPKPAAPPFTVSDDLWSDFASAAASTNSVSAPQNTSSSTTGNLLDF